MKRLAALLGFAMTLAMPATAQNAPTFPTLTANGAGESFAVPDIAIVSLGVTTRADTPTAALESNNTDMKRVVDAIRGAGVEEKDVATSGFSISPVYAGQEPGRENVPPKVIAYEVGNQVTVRIRNLANSGPVLDKVVAAGANTVNGISFDIADPQAAKDEATRLAIADARRKGELIAEASGVRLVRLVSVSTFDGGGPVFAARSFDAPTPILGGERSISVNATLVWEIAPK